MNRNLFSIGDFIALPNSSELPRKYPNDCGFILGFNEKEDVYDIYWLENFQGDLAEELRLNGLSSLHLLQASRRYIDEHYHLYVRR